MVKKAPMWHKPGDAEQARNVEQFRSMVLNPYRIMVPFRYPNVKLAPWHIQAKVNGHVINFWPHLLKCYCETIEGGARIGVAANIRMIEYALNNPHQDPVLIE
jgi:hypothetical protein